MKMTTRIAYANLKYHKSKNILIGVAVILTTLLLFLVPIIGKSMIDGQFAVVREIYPTWHALFDHVDEDTVKKLSAHHNVAVYGLRSDAGRIVDDKAKISMMYIDNSGFSLYRMKLLEGDLPEKENEIVVSNSILDELGQTGKKIGDTITVAYQIYRNGGLDLKEEKEFVISGLTWDNSSSIEKKVYYVFVSKDFLESEVPKDQITYRFLFQVNGKKNSVINDIENTIKSIAEQFSIEKNSILMNQDYLMANYVDPVVLPVMVGIMIIIVLAGVITIYSIYYVGMTERIQEFGKLKAMGATKHQIKEIVLREGLGVTMIAIPIGLFIGTILSRVVFFLFLSIYKDENPTIGIMKDMLSKKQFSLNHWWIYLLTIVVAILTMYISLLKPMKIASSISEMEAIRYQPKETSIRKGKRIKRYNRKSFSEVTIPKLSFIYLFGNKKKSIITIVSMGITGVFLMVVATVLSCANPRESASNSVLGQYEISLNVETGNKEHPEREWSNIVKNNPLTKELEEKIKDIKGIKYISTFGAVIVSSEIFEGDSQGVCGVPKEYSNLLEEGIIKGRATYDDLKSGDKVIVDKNLLHWYPDIKIGDILYLTVEDGTGSQKKVEVVAIGDYSIGFSNYNYLFMAEEGANKLSDYNMNEVFHIFAEKDYNRDTENALNRLISQDDRLELQTWQQRFDEWESALAMTSGACYALLGVLGMICVMNMINTMIHSVHVRKKELGMMQAIGMTDRQLELLLQQEGLFYTIGTLLLSVGLGSILGYPVFLWAKYNGLFNISNYHYPAAAAVVVSMVLLLIQVILAFTLGKSVRKESLIERIRFSE
jgi:putative ABC transport system permease protein